MPIFWNGRDIDDPFGRWIEVPKELKDKSQTNKFMEESRAEHEKKCQDDSFIKLHVRCGPGDRYWKFDENMRGVDVEYYAERFGKTVEDTFKMLVEDGFPVCLKKD